MIEANEFLQPDDPSYTPGSSLRGSGNSQPPRPTPHPELSGPDLSGKTAPPPEPRKGAHPLPTQRRVNWFDLVPPALAAAALILVLNARLPASVPEFRKAIPEILTTMACLATIFGTTKSYGLGHLVSPVLTAILSGATIYASLIPTKPIPPAPPNPIRIERFQIPSPAKKRIRKLAPPVRQNSGESAHVPQASLAPAHSGAFYFDIQPREGLESAFRDLSKTQLRAMQVFLAHIPASWDQHELDAQKRRWGKACGVFPEWIDQWSAFKDSTEGCHIGGVCIIVTSKCDSSVLASGNASPVK